MRLLRPLLVALTAICLIALPGAVSASADSGLVSGSGVAAKAERFATRIAFMDFDHLRAYASSTVIRGQVLTDHGGPGGEGSLPATVTLSRRYKGSPTWEQIRIAETTQNTTAPRFTFEVRTNANAFYRVNFKGDADNLPSSATTEVSAYRTITSAIKPKLLLMYGKVAPNYAGKRLFIERKTCAACSYERVRSTLVNATSHYKVTLAAPRRGRWFFRLSTPATAQFVTSYSGVVTTSRG